MIRLIQIEYMKLKNTKFFWVFTLLLGVVLLAVPLFSKSFLDFLTAEGAEVYGIGLNDLPLFDFLDIWQNLTFLYKWPIILLAFIPVISMANEFRYGTIKQNIIDGMSRNELIKSKLLFAGVLSLIVSFLILIIGLIMGFLWSPVNDFGFIVKHIEFVFAFSLIVFGYQAFCMMITLLVKKSGITILLLLFYFFALEGIGYALVKWDSAYPELIALFPLRGMAEIVQNPFPKYALQEVYSSVRLKDLAITLGHISLYTFLSFWIFQRRDIR